MPGYDRHRGERGKEAGIDRPQQEAKALVRYHQHQDALANDRAFQPRYRVPADVRKQPSNRPL